MSKMAEIDYENQQTNKDGTEGVVDLEKEMKPKKKKTTKTKPKIDPFDERLKEVEKNLEIAGNTLDKMQDNIKNAVDLLGRVAKRMGLE